LNVKTFVNIICGSIISQNLGNFIRAKNNKKRSKKMGRFFRSYDIFRQAFLGFAKNKNKER
jgi:hypothetical protein